MKRLKEKLRKWKGTMKRKTRNVLFALTFWTGVFATMSYGNAYAEEHQDATNAYDVVQDDFNNSLDVIDLNEENRGSFYTIGESVYMHSGALIYADEYRMTNQVHGSHMLYPKGEKKITACVFLVDNQPMTVFSQEKAKEYSSLYELSGYLINGTEGFVRADSVYRLEDAISEVVSQSSTIEPDISSDSLVTSDVLSVSESDMIASPSSAKVATASNSVASPSNIKEATLSNASVLTVADIIATHPEASKSTASVATSSNAVNDSVSNVSSSIYLLNEQVSIKPNAIFYRNVKKLNQLKGGKKYPYELTWNKVTGIVVGGKVYHEKDVVKLVEALNHQGVIEGYEINHVRYLKPDCLYRSSQIDMTEAELEEKIQGVYPKEVSLTIRDEASIYEEAKDMKHEKRQKTPYYKKGTSKEIFSYVISDGTEYYTISSYEKVKEYLSFDEFEFVGYLVVNQYSRNIFGQVKAYEGFYHKNDVMPFEDFANVLNPDVSLATSSNASPSEAKMASVSNASPSEARKITSASVSHNQVDSLIYRNRELYESLLCQLQELKNQRNKDFEMAKKIDSKQLTRKL